MAIRIRKVEDIWIALCAVESDAQEDDIYLDDGIHYALTTKFMDDFNFEADERLLKLMNKEKVRDAKEELEKWFIENET